MSAIASETYSIGLTVADLQPSKRLRNAAAAELPRLRRQRERLLARHAEAQRKADALKDALDELDERAEQLEHLATGAAEPAIAEREVPDDINDCLLVEGADVRYYAVRALLLAQRESAHYRDWYELLSASGVLVCGKDPLAVFLTQLTHSPVIRKSTKAGVYELDLNAPVRLRAELDRLSRERGDLEAVIAEQGGLPTPEQRSARRELNLGIDRQERQLAEAQRVLGEPEGRAGGTARGATKGRAGTLGRERSGGS